MQSILLAIGVMLLTGFGYGAYGAYQIWKMGQFEYNPSPDRPQKEEKS